ncbi:MAG TPA: ATP-binding cassette domain-containing protein [Telluria sp.]|nr:ATP-binding cassette domain-containing protein [Telluria sp.]
MTTVALRNLHLDFDGQPILRDVNLTIEAGQFCVFIGPSGCGKSTLLRLIAGLETASGGDILIDGVRVNDVAPAKRGLAMVFQGYALYPHMTVRENMAFGLERQGLPRAQIDVRVDEAARILQLEALLARKPGALSGGQRQRVAIGRAIVKHPKVFLFDEPLSNLDASLRSQTRIEIARLHRQLKTASMIYVTHDQVEAMTLADRIVLLQPAASSAGLPSIAQVGAPLELYHHPANLYAAGFIGSPAMNFLPARVADANAAEATVELMGQRCRALVDGAGLPTGAAVTLGIRPEHVRVGSGTWRGTVTHLEALGEHSYVHLSFGPDGTTLVAKTELEDVRVGAPLDFDFPPSALHLFTADGNACRRHAAKAAP